MLRKPIALLFAAAIVVTLAACGGDDSGSIPAPGATLGQLGLRRAGRELRHRWLRQRLRRHHRGPGLLGVGWRGVLRAGEGLRKRVRR